MERRCKNCYNPLTLEQTECPNCGALNYLPEGTKNDQGVTISYTRNPNDYPMRWFKFVIYVQLFLNCLANLGNGVLALNGTQYGDEAELIYSLLPSLKQADSFHGIALILLAAFALVVRFRLAGFHRDGPTLYLIHIVAQSVVALIYVFMASAALDTLSVVDTSSLWAEVMPSLLANGVLLVCNYIYFKKRRDVFFC